MRRFVESSSVPERAAMVPALLRFPLIAHLNRLEEREYEHPLAVFHIHKIPFPREIAIADTSLETFFGGAFSDQFRVRRSAISALAVLHDARMLDQNLTQL